MKHLAQCLANKEHAVRSDLSQPLASGMCVLGLSLSLSLSYLHKVLGYAQKSWEGTSPVAVGRHGRALWSGWGRFLHAPAFGGGRASDFTELRAGFQLYGTNAPDLQAGAAGRCFPLQSVSFHSFLIDLRNASVEAALPLQPQQDSEGWIPFLFSLPRRSVKLLLGNPRLEDKGPTKPEAGEDGQSSYL